MNDMVKNLLLWLVIAAVLLSVFNNFNMQSPSDQVGYSDFIEEIQREQVKKVVVDGLTISGERKKEEEVKEEHYHRTERYYGKFSRSFALPDSVDTEKVEATFKGGVMRLELPKKEAVKPKEIKINIES